MARQVTLFILLFLVALIPRGQKKEKAEDYKAIYNTAERLYKSPNSNDKTDSVAIASYHRVIQILSKLLTNDSILLNSYVKAGILEMSYQQFNESIRDFKAAIVVGYHNKSVPDSLLFKPYLYSGSIYYDLFNFDSSLYYYRKAERIVATNAAVGETERLYNKLGVLFFETGDYKRSITYFEKALSIIETRSSAGNSFVVNYKNNIASAYRKLHRFNDALNIYKSLLYYGFNKPELLHNIGATYLAEGAAKQAIEYLRQVTYHNQVKYNDLAAAYLQLHQYDSASYLLKQASALYRKKSNKLKDNDFGITLKLEGDLLLATHKTRDALQKYQHAIVEIDPDFTDTAVERNPTIFAGLHNSFLLFELIKAKAKALSKYYEETNNIEDLSNAFTTYSSALTLAGDVERTYHSDEAKLFLEQNVSAAFKDAVKAGLQLFGITRNKMYLKQAFSLAENSKASILQTDLQEAELNEIAKLPNALVQEQKTLQTSIARFNFQLSETKDSLQLQKLNNALRDAEIKLSGLQEKIDDYPGYQQLKFSGKQVNTDSIQQKILSNDEAILSYYYFGKQLICFYITKESFGYKSTPFTPELLNDIAILRTQLRASESADRKIITIVSTNLYKALLAPVYSEISNKHRLVIIPYNELSYVPFEVLATTINKPLLYQFAVSYNYSINFLSTNRNTIGSYTTLAVAPFTANPNHKNLTALRYSEEEVAGLKGKTLQDKEATKQQFLNFYSAYSVIHLATHATVNDTLPLQSYIEFFADHPDVDTSHRLYEQEIYHLNMKEALLVILSACETGNGQLINEEGVISLSRAFSYAGCKSVITSLWKADDAATAFIIRKVHYYLKKGNTKDRALQKAKIDYLESNEIAAKYKTPQYWAHLVLIGNSEPIMGVNLSFVILTAITIMLSVVLIIKQSRAK